MCNAIPILSPFFLYHPYIPLFNSKNFLFSSLPPFFMHVCIHKVQWIHRRQGTKVPKQIAILPDNGNVGLHVCAEFHDQTYTVLYALSKV